MTILCGVVGLLSVTIPVTVAAQVWGHPPPDTCAGHMPYVDRDTRDAMELKRPTVFAFTALSPDSLRSTLDSERTVATSLGFQFRVVYNARCWVTGAPFGYWFQAREHVEVVPGLLPPNVLRRRIRAFLRPEWVKAVLHVWPIVASILIMTLMSLTPVVRRPATWAGVSATVIGLSLIPYSGIVMTEVANRGTFLLHFDVVASFAFAAGTPALVSWSAWGLRRVRPFLRITASLACAFAFIVASTFIVVLVHCMNGDCF